MKYISTRGQVEAQGFIDTVLMGLADDGGLMIPAEIPHITPETLKEWSKLSYKELFLQIFALYTNQEIPDEDLKNMVDKSYASFRDSEITPVNKIDDSLYILELFHGPTFAFKDVALQFMGEFYSYVSKKQNKIIHILGATSGDTGAAAIQGVRGKEGIKICILHPHNKVSKVQELQMTTVDDQNVLNLSVKGNFDDCQKIIKDQFADLEFKSKHNLRAINSINFLRILAQTVYYFYAYFQIEQGDQPKKVNISVPSGNFGNIFSGFLAKKMGLPIHKLIIATNENNILERFVKTGEYKPGDFKSTHSPSMDIQVASNFERYLYYFLDQDAAKVSAIMKKFQDDGKIVFNAEDLVRVQADFVAYGASNEQCLELISKYKDNSDYLLDPHTACGIAAYEAYNGEEEICISFATAHPAKFNEAIEQCDIKQEFPAEIKNLFSKSQHQLVIDHNKEDIVRELEAFYEK
ncbi:threonine synthase [Paenibacillus crassostreae]|uniref:Threonine synthase n=1 Tax=Paenibacillus crassostreae TaxID=1763538 RepID=A0A167ANP7_9BACL|nr:threonine synthase [Paenibacillus crassostreae]AOZ93716.1 threonine synthase [Paenibacillus crassostreae]OAB71251.1 threonine synthase [Paenibacillus crassostreae]